MMNHLSLPRRIPLALFTYNRPIHTKATLNALKNCEGRDLFDFYFFSDAPRSDFDINLVEEVRHVLHIYTHEFKARVIYQSTNLGLAKSIVNGVSSLCDSYGWVVVLEDDLLVHRLFLIYMAEALSRYQYHDSVMQVVASSLIGKDQKRSEAYFLPITCTWGWATWKRAWKHFSWSPNGWPDTAFDQDWMDVFQVGGSFDYASMLVDRINMKNNSWGILWWYVVSRLNGHALYPQLNLVLNIGFDGSGVHCSANNSSSSTLRYQSEFFSEPTKTLNYPSDVFVKNEDYQLLKLELSRLQGLSSNHPSTYHRLAKRLRSLFQNAFI